MEKPITSVMSNAKPAEKEITSEFTGAVEI